jgi:hypothetical protein
MGDIEKQVTEAVLTRRRMFGLLAATGAGLVATASPASAFFNLFHSYGPAPSGTLDGLGIPEEWRRVLGPSLPSYAHYLKSLGLGRISVKQVIAPHTKKRGNVQNTLPPKQMWRNVQHTLRVIDGLSRRLELRPEELISIYRSPAYNARCAGARSNSWHMRNNAVDLEFPCAPGKVAAMAKEMRAVGLFKGGIGRYRGFTHIDTRGSNVDWRG